MDYHSRQTDPCGSITSHHPVAPRSTSANSHGSRHGLRHRAGTESEANRNCKRDRVDIELAHDRSFICSISGCRDSGIARYRARFHAASLDVSYFLHALLPSGELLLRFILGAAIRFLDLAGKAVALARNDVELIIGELAPL